MYNPLILLLGKPFCISTNVLPPSVDFFILALRDMIMILELFSAITACLITPVKTLAAFCTQVSPKSSDFHTPSLKSYNVIWLFGSITIGATNEPSSEPALKFNTLEYPPFSVLFLIAYCELPIAQL